MLATFAQHATRYVRWSLMSLALFYNVSAAPLPLIQNREWLRQECTRAFDVRLEQQNDPSRAPTVGWVKGDAAP